MDQLYFRLKYNRLTFTMGGNGGHSFNFFKNGCQISYIDGTTFKSSKDLRYIDPNYKC